MIRLVVSKTSLSQGCDMVATMLTTLTTGESESVGLARPWADHFWY